MMRQLGNQVRQVAIVYVTLRRSRGWLLAVGLAAAMLFVFTSVGAGEDHAPITIAYAFIYASWVSNLISDQVKHQFSHPRARLMPGFAVPHVTVPLVITFATTVVLPALIALLRHRDGLSYSAIASFSIAIILLSQLFPRIWVAIALIALAIWLPSDLGLDTHFSTTQLRPLHSISLLACGWLGIGYYFFKLCWLAEDDATYQRLDDETRKVSADGAEGQTRAKFMQYARWCVLSDRWHARIGGFHQFRTRRIIRLLRYGFGATPVELTATGCAILMTIAVSRLVPKTDDSYDITRSTDFVFLIVPALFASLAPVAVAGSAMGLRVPRLKNEILFPLTRRKLIDDLFLTSAWYSLLIWLLGCASGSGILLYVLPAESNTVSLFATAALLTAATGIVAYGLSLCIVLWEVKAAQFFTLGLFVLGSVILMVSWWTSREKAGDAPYWIIAAIVSGVGVLMIRSARDVWLNLELGQV